MSFTRIDHYEKEYADTHHDTALNVTQGVEEQPIVSPYFKRRKKRALSTGEYVEGILAGNITTLSQAITLVESSNPNHYAQAQEIIEACLPHAGKSVRIGITGVPGAGKSTFIEAIGNMVAGLRHKLAVLAIDPSSERSGGSILGDKTRMESICNNPSVFVRPSPSAGSLGGVARKTRETIVLCEAAGFDVIFIETVGVGQSETAVHSMVDLFMLLQISGAGDELQGIKRGIMEMADLMVITKADGENIHKAELAQTQFQGALRLFPVPESGWRPKVYTSSAVARTGLEEVWKGVEEYLDHIQKNGYFQHNRNRQNKYWMYESINEVLRNSFYHDPAAEARVAQARWDLEQKQLRAPASGLVYDTLFRAGEWVPAGSPVVQVLPPGNVKIRFFVPEPLVGGLKTGGQVLVRADGRPEPFAAAVSYVASNAEYTPPVIYSNETRSKLVFMVEARPEPGIAAELHPGQPVSVSLP